MGMGGLRSAEVKAAVTAGNGEKVYDWIWLGRG